MSVFRKITISRNPFLTNSIVALVLLCCSVSFVTAEECGGPGDAIVLQFLVDSLPEKSHVWRNRSQLSTAVGARWNGTASLRITSAPEDLRLLNLNYINSETFFNFSCYQSGR